jgi:hypothetical protein
LSPSPQVAQDRREHWKKFGEAASERAADSVTSQTPDEVPLERVQRQKQTQEEKEKSKAADFQTAMAGNDKTAIVGSLRDMLYKKRMERQLLAAKGLIAAPERPPDEVGYLSALGWVLAGGRGAAKRPKARLWLARALLCRSMVWSVGLGGLVGACMS